MKTTRLHVGSRIHLVEVLGYSKGQTIVHLRTIRDVGAAVHSMSLDGKTFTPLDTDESKQAARAWRASGKAMRWTLPVEIAKALKMNYDSEKV